MEIVRSQVDALEKLVVTGELDASTAIEMDNELKSLLQDGKINAIIDLSGLDYISSAGVGVFISFIDDFQEQEGNLVLFGMQENVYEVFSMLGLDGILTIVDTEDAAKGSF